MKATTWNRESHGLFDYGSQQVSSKNLKATSSAKIVRIQNDIHLATDLSSDKTLSQNCETLAFLNHQDGSYLSFFPPNSLKNLSQITRHIYFK